MSSEDDAHQVPQQLEKRPLLIQIGIVIKQWFRNRRRNREKPTWFGRIVKIILSLGVVTVLLKVATEKTVEQFTDRAKAAVIEWHCDMKKLHTLAQTHIRAAYDAWDKKNVAGFHREYAKAVGIYEKTVESCKSKDAAYQLMLAYCRGYGVKQNAAVGRHFMKTIEDDTRLLDKRKEEPNFCSG